MLIRAGWTLNNARKGAIYARDVLRRVGSRILGVVVSDVPRRKGVYGYYYTDAETYSYGYASKSLGSNGAKKQLTKAEEPPKELV